MKSTLPLNRSGIVGIVVVIVLVVLGFAFADRFGQTSPTNTDGITVTTSIFPLTDIAQQIAGDRITVVQLLPNGASPHTYALAPQQLVSLQQSAALFVIGHNLDSWATRAATQTNTPVIEVDEGIALREFGPDDAHEHDHHDEPHQDEEHEDEHGHEEEEHEEEHNHAEGVDPHYWLNIPNGQQIARTIAARLQAIDPTNSDTYEQNLNTYLQQLNTTEGELQAAIAAAPGKKFVAIHDAWGYFTDHYGFDLLATYEPVEGRAPSLAELEELRQIVLSNGITTFYTEPQKRSSSAIRFLEEELGLSIDVLDPIGGAAPHDSYENLIRANVENLLR